MANVIKNHNQKILNYCNEANVTLEGAIAEIRSLK